MERIPYGLWPSNISPAHVTGGKPRLSDMQISESGLWWLESRPQENGRTVLIFLPLNRFDLGNCDDVYVNCEAFIEVTSTEYSVRTKVHEYGGRAFWTHKNTAYFSNIADGRIYRTTFDKDKGNFTNPTPITAMTEYEQRFADGDVSQDGTSIVVVRELHLPSEVKNQIVVIDLQNDNSLSVLFEDSDFVSNPKLSPNSNFMSFLTWNKPSMPWDSNLWKIAKISRNNHMEIEEIITVDDANCSTVNPIWLAESILFASSDHFSQWWNIVRVKNFNIERFANYAFEMAWPQWIFGRQTFTAISEDKVVAAFFDPVGDLAGWKLGIFSSDSYNLIDSNLVSISEVVYCQRLNCIFALGGTTTNPSLIICINLTSLDEKTYYEHTKKRVSDSTLFKSKIDKTEYPVHLQVPCKDGGYTYALLYLPVSEFYHGLKDELPPLIVTSHGGPTSAADASYNATFQFFVTRGFALVDINYRGSTGFGREYREQLNGQWGIYDVEDIIGVTEFLIEKGKVDKNRCVIRGSSASGLTVYLSLVKSSIFQGGTSYYGVSDLELLAKDTHKFESCYLDTLIGQYPKDIKKYKELSPVNLADHIKTPLLVFQGLDDPVVPPSQAENIVSIVRSNSIKCEYVVFEGESHGFRKASTIETALSKELDFYHKILKIKHVD